MEITNRRYTSMYILGNGRLITRSQALPYLENGAVCIDGTKIKAVGETAALRARYPEAEFLDARGGVIMPAFINAHTHIYRATTPRISMRCSTVPGGLLTAS